MFKPWRLPLFLTFESVEPRTAAEPTAYGEWLDQTFDREQSRIERAKAGSGVIPGPLWAILIVSAGLVLAYGLFFVDRDEGKVLVAIHEEQAVREHEARADDEDRPQTGRG